MGNSTKIPSFLTLFYVLFLLHHLAVAVNEDSPSPYTPTEKIFVACGWNGTANTPENRTWIGDIDSEYSPLEQPKNASTPFTNQRDPPYSKSRVSHSVFTYRFNVTAGQKFIRLHFFSTSYSGFDSSKAFFSVKADSFILLRNFSVSLTADVLGKVFKEFCINIEEDQRLLNITFTPSPDYQDSYAFISGIEIVSMPPSIYYTAANDPGFSFVGQATQYNIKNSNAFQTLYRINVGGKSISPSDDTGMYRTWDGDDIYVNNGGVLPVNTTIALSFRKIPNYSAPSDVYKTARTMGLNKTINENYNLTWEFEVDSSFIYFLRLHFCEFQIEITDVGNRVFQIYIANQTAEREADVIAWSGGNGVPIYRDYAVLIGSKGNEKKQKLSIALHPTPEWRTKYSDAILNGIEIFKVDNNGILAGPNPDPSIISPSDAPPSPQSTKSKNHRAVIIGIVAGIVSSFVVLSLLFLFISRRTRKVKNSSFSGGNTFWGAFVSSTTKSTKSHCSSLPSDLCTHFSHLKSKQQQTTSTIFSSSELEGLVMCTEGRVDSNCDQTAESRVSTGCPVIPN